MTKSSVTEFKTIRPSQAVRLIRRCFAKGRAAMIWGPPGIGKSDLIAQIGEQDSRPVIDMRLLIMEPTDLKGIPYYDPTTNTMRWAPPDELPKPGEVAMENAILFLDEINAAPQAVQAAAYQLILNRRVGQYRLPKGVSIVAAGNRETDKAVTFRMPSALANRFVHFEMKHSFEDWFDWAIKNKIHPDVVGFLKAHTHKLFDFDPKKSGKAFATPRSWSFVSDLIDDEMTEQENEYMTAGAVGDGIAGEFMQHRRLKGVLPDPMDVLLGKVKKFKNDEKVDISAKYSLTLSLCYNLSELEDRYKAKQGIKGVEWSNISDNFLQFMMGNLTEEMIIMGASVAMRKFDISLETETETFDEFFTKYQKWVAG
jgi:hypothetical protein